MDADPDPLETFEESYGTRGSRGSGEAKQREETGSLQTLRIRTSRCSRWGHCGSPFWWTITIHLRSGFLKIQIHQLTRQIPRDLQLLKQRWKILRLRSLIWRKSAICLRPVRKFKGEFLERSWSCIQQLVCRLTIHCYAPLSILLFKLTSFSSWNSSCISASDSSCGCRSWSLGQDFCAADPGRSVSVGGSDRSFA